MESSPAPARASLVVASVPGLLHAVNSGSLCLARVGIWAADEVDAVLCGDDPHQATRPPEAQALWECLQGGERGLQSVLTTAHLSPSHEADLRSHFPNALRVRQESPGGGRPGALVPTLRQRFHYFNPVFTTKDDKLLQDFDTPPCPGWGVTAPSHVPR